MNLHEMIHRCQQIIINSLKDASPECVILFAKDRIDETNLPKVSALAKDLLPPEQFEQVDKALGFLKRALSDLCEEHNQWALNVGAMYSRAYRVSHIDGQSLALEGLYKAAIRFQPSGSFKSYVRSWIRQCIQRSVDNNLSFTLNSPIKQGETSTQIELISADDSVWGSSHFYARDPFVLEELRLQYCPHLSMEEMKGLLSDKELAESVGC